MGTDPFQTIVSLHFFKYLAAGCETEAVYSEGPGSPKIGVIPVVYCLETPKYRLSKFCPIYYTFSFQFIACPFPIFFFVPMFYIYCEFLVKRNGLIFLYAFSLSGI